MVALFTIVFAKFSLQNNHFLLIKCLFTGFSDMCGDLSNWFFI